MVMQPFPVPGDLPSKRVPSTFAQLTDDFLLVFLPALAAAWNGNLDELNELVTNAPLAIQAAATAEAAALTALNAPGTVASSTTELTIPTSLPADLSLLIQPGKTIVTSMSVVLGSTTNPTVRMGGVVTSYDAETGAFDVHITEADGGGTFAAWTVSLGYMPSASSPSGTVISALAAPDATWLPCDGSRYTAATHPALAALLAGTSFTLDDSNMSRVTSIYDLAYDGAGRLVAAGNGGILTSDDDGVTWDVAVLTGRSHYCVAYSSGVWVVAGDGGNIWVSSDGVNFELKNTGVATNIIGLAHNGTTWVALYSGQSYIRYASDPLGTWTPVSPTNLTTVTTMTYAGGLFLIGGNHASGSIWTSADGITWTQRSSASPSYTVRKIVHNGSGLFVAVGDTGRCHSSPDGATWTSRSAGSTTFRDLKFANSLWVAVGDAGVCYTSTDGTTWASRTTGTSVAINQVVYAFGYWWGGPNSGGYGLLYSADAINWNRNWDLLIGNIYPSYYCQDQMVFTGTALVIGDQSGGVTRTTDGSTWERRRFTSLIGASIQKYPPYGGTDGTQFIFAGTSGLIKTTDGGEWIYKKIGTVEGEVFYSIGYLNGLWIACGAVNLYTSTDGVSWAARQAGAFYSVAFGNGVWVAVGSAGTCYTSTNGTSWTSRSAGGLNFCAVAYGNGAWVAFTSNSGYVYASADDGVTWAQNTNAPLASYVFGAFLGGVFIGVNSSNTQLSMSVDGMSWYYPNTKITPGGMYMVAYGHGAWVAACNGTTEVGPALLYSEDAQNFFPSVMGDAITDDIYAVVFDGTSFLASGGSALYVSDDGKNWRKHLTDPAWGFPVVFKGKTTLLASASVCPESSTEFTVPLVSGMDGIPSFIKGG